MTPFYDEIERFRRKMVEQSQVEIDQIAALDQALLEDDIALRDMIRTAKAKHEGRRHDILLELQSFAEALGTVRGGPRLVQGEAHDAQIGHQPRDTSVASLMDYPLADQDDPYLPRFMGERAYG